MNSRIPPKSLGMISRAIDQIGPWSSEFEIARIREQLVVHLRSLCPFLASSEILDEFKRQIALREHRASLQTLAPLSLKSRFLRHLLKLGVNAIWNCGFVLPYALAPQLEAYSRPEQSWIVFQSDGAGSGVKFLCSKLADGRCLAGKIPVGIGSIFSAQQFLKHCQPPRKLLQHPTARPNFTPSTSSPSHGPATIHSIAF